MYSSTLLHSKLGNLLYVFHSTPYTRPDHSDRRAIGLILHLSGWSLLPSEGSSFACELSHDVRSPRCWCVDPVSSHSIV
jgi:hypothetical protein